MTKPKDLPLRPALRRFSQAMEKELRRHDAVKGRAGWKHITNGMTMPYLITKNFAALTLSLHEDDNKTTVDKSIDLANLCMMVFDLTDIEEPVT